MHRAAPMSAELSVPAPTWAALLTVPRAPKADRLRRVVEGLRGGGLRVAGFVQERASGAPRSYDLRRLGGDDRVPIARRGTSPAADEIPFCSCAFRPAAFDAARGWLDADLPGAEVVVLDEISRLEAVGQGHAGAVALALARAPVTILSIRTDRLAALVERFGLPEPCASSERDDDVDALVAAITSRS